MSLRSKATSKVGAAALVGVLLTSASVALLYRSLYGADWRAAITSSGGWVAMIAIWLSLAVLVTLGVLTLLNMAWVEELAEDPHEQPRDQLIG